jgi:hypothetical protein
VPEYIPQLFSFGDTARIKGGQAIKAMGKFRAKVGRRKTSATSAGNSPTSVNCQRIAAVPMNKVTA